MIQFHMGNCRTSFFSILELKVLIILLFKAKFKFNLFQKKGFYNRSKKTGSNEDNQNYEYLF